MGSNLLVHFFSLEVVNVWNMITFRGRILISVMDNMWLLTHKFKLLLSLDCTKKKKKAQRITNLKQSFQLNLNIFFLKNLV